MEKQTIIITGASSGIGKEIARYFLNKGANVVINSSNFERLKSVYEEFGAGENVAMIAGDVMLMDTGRKLCATAVERFGSVDVLINNAGIYQRKAFLDVDEPELDRFLNTNLKGTFFTTQGIIPQMIKQHNGVVINIGTTMVGHALAGVPATALVSSKGAIHALTLQLAAEFGKDNIRVNTIALGVIQTSVQGRKGEVAGLNLLNHLGDMEEVVKMVYTVATSNFITGTTINVDGGMAGGHQIN